MVYLYWEEDFMDNNEIKSITIADNEEFLRQKSAMVDIKNDQDLNENIKVLDKFCKNNGVMAMAAVQLGIPKRIVYLKLCLTEKEHTNLFLKLIMNYLILKLQTRKKLA